METKFILLPLETMVLIYTFTQNYNDFQNHCQSFLSKFFFLFSASFRFFLLSVLLSFLLLSNWFLFLSSFVFPLLFRHCFIPVSLAYVVSSLAYPNLLETKRLGCCCCCCCSKSLSKLKRIYTYCNTPCYRNPNLRRSKFSNQVIKIWNQNSKLRSKFCLV
jgi:hypothetical protein